MGQQPAQSKSGTVWQRLLIMVFGFAIVAIGSQPIHKKYGSLGAFFKKNTTAFAKEPTVGSKGEAFELKSFTLSNKKASEVQTKADNDKKKKLDKLDSSDRKQLDNLVNEL